MTQKDLTPGQYISEADTALEETAARLREILHQAAGRLDPFPSFYGSLTLRAVEAEPPEGQGNDRGCVVVCADGDLYELTVDFSPSPFGFSTNVEREEKITKLDLPPLTYISYAYNALAELTRLLSRGGRP
ncbi:MAG: hypothetical protein IIC81_00580 [Chloroflexi bacterium]|nr:hypothetical protein [Chloroflexota bacterium]